MRLGKAQQRKEWPVAPRVGATFRRPSAHGASPRRHSRVGGDHSHPKGEVRPLRHRSKPVIRVTQTPRMERHE